MASADSTRQKYCDKLKEHEFPAELDLQKQSLLFSRQANVRSASNVTTKLLSFQLSKFPLHSVLYLASLAFT